MNPAQIKSFNDLATDLILADGGIDANTTADGAKAIGQHYGAVAFNALMGVRGAREQCEAALKASGGGE